MEEKIITGHKNGMLVLLLELVSTSPRSFF